MTVNLLMMAVLASGCVSSTVRRDLYPTHKEKGYAVLSAEVEPSHWIIRGNAFQVVDGKAKDLGRLQTGGVAESMNWSERDYTCAYHIVASAPPGVAAFFFGLDRPFTVDVYNCMTTRVMVVFSDPRRVSFNETLWNVTLEIDDPFKGHIKQNAQIAVQREIAGATFVVSGTDNVAVWSMFAAIDKSTEGLSLKNNKDAKEFKIRFSQMRSARPDLSTVRVVCAGMGDL